MGSLTPFPKKLGLLVSSSNQPIVKQLGLQPYEGIYERMLNFQSQRTGDTPDQFWLLEHEAVFTLGRNGNKEHILQNTSIPIVPIDRGGQVTYHAPGQLILYTLMDLKRNNIGVKQWVNHLENSVIHLLGHFGVQAESNPQAPGVYVEGRKIAALGLRVSKGRCYHGLSLNVDMDLTPFNIINPCGYEGLEVTQCADLGIKVSLKVIGGLLIKVVSDICK